MRFTTGARHEITWPSASRYRKANRKGKGQMLNEFCESTGCNRSYTGFLLRGYGKSRVVGRGSYARKLVQVKQGRKPRERPRNYGAEGLPIIKILGQKSRGTAAKAQFTELFNDELRAETIWPGKVYASMHIEVQSGNSVEEADRIAVEVHTKVHDAKNCKYCVIYIDPFQGQHWIGRNKPTRIWALVSSSDGNSYPIYGAPALGSK